MQNLYKYLFSITLIFFIHGVANAQSNESYDDSFHHFLADVKENSIRNRDWSEADWNNYIQAQSAKLPVNNKQVFYKLVTEALQDLNDHHSFLIPATLPHDNKKLTSNKVRVEEGIGIIDIPNNYIPNRLGDNVDTNDFLNESVVAEFHTQLEAIKPQVTKGWIINLSENSGGNMYPMLGCLSDFFVNKNIGGFYLYQLGKEPVTQKIYFDGKHFIFDGEIGATFKNSYPAGTVSLPTVVIISHQTASSGEVVALALERQPNITLIGQPSFGLATGNSMMMLPNKLGRYMLTVGNDLDKNDKPLLSEKVYPAILFDFKSENLIQAAKQVIQSLR